MAESFPRRQARTRRFTLGQPRTFAVADDGSRVAFLRSRAGDDPVTCLWMLRPDTGEEKLVADPGRLGADEKHLPPEERARRERARETAGGIVSYAADPSLRLVAFAQGGRSFVAWPETGEVQALAAPGPVNDPRPDPTGTRVAYVCDGALWTVEVGGGEPRRLVGEEDPEVTWGLAEFVAAEEMGRGRGFWWSPDGQQLAVARVDTGPVTRWHISNPTEPSSSPQVVAYPAAGTANAEVSLFLVDLNGVTTEVPWDHAPFPYLARVVWNRRGPLTLLVQSRDQRTTRVLASRPDGTEVLSEETDAHWVDLVGGAPDWLADGRLVTVAGRDDTHRVLFDGEPVTPVGLQVRRIVAVDEDVLFVGSEEPTEAHLFRVDAGGEVTALTDEPGVHDCVASGPVVVVVSSSMSRERAAVTVTKGGEAGAEIVSRAESPGLELRVQFLEAGPRALRTAVLLPSQGWEGKLPVLLDPYGGPGAQRVIRSAGAYWSSQWMADQGFAVVVADGRGTPGRGLAWERAIAGDFATAVLDDQVAALEAAAAVHADLDLGRVAIRGWSFGGYLAALAVLRRPDVFHAAVAGAPVTDWRLYDTHYTERYLGHPEQSADAYERSSLMADANRLERPLLLIHGLADDNVVVAHTLQLSRAFLEAGRPHSVLPLSGVTHMTPQDVVAENLLLVQLAFLRQALGLG